MRTCICNVNVVDLEKGWLPFFGVCYLCIGQPFKNKIDLFKQKISLIQKAYLTMFTSFLLNFETASLLYLN